MRERLATYDGTVTRHCTTGGCVRPMATIVTFTDGAKRCFCARCAGKIGAPKGSVRRFVQRGDKLVEVTTGPVMEQR
jgi:hypothetical protein